MVSFERYKKTPMSSNDNVPTRGIRWMNAFTVYSGKFDSGKSILDLKFLSFSPKDLGMHKEMKFSGKKNFSVPVKETNSGKRI